MMVLRTPLGPRIRYIAIEMGFETASRPLKTPVPTAVLSG